MNSLQQDIHGWDGKSAEAIQQIYACHPSEMMAGELIAMLDDESLQNGATWLLRHHLEQGHAIEASAARSLFRQLHQLAHWEAQLHVLQAIPHLRIPARYRGKVEAFLRECLDSDNKFVRAWAYGGFHELAQQHEEYAAEAKALLAEAIQSEAPSVKARLRQLKIEL